MELTKSNLLEKYITMANYNIFCYSRDCAMTQPKEGFEKEWQEARNELDMLVYIAKLVNKEENAPVGETRERMQYLVNSMLSGATTAIAEETEGNRVFIKIIDDVERKPLAVLNFEKVYDHYLLKNYELL